MSNSNNFRTIIPAELTKSEDGEWKIKGLASTRDVDQQGEIILQEGIDLTPIDQKKGLINYDHKTGPDNVIGLLDGYVKNENGLYIEGRLFKNHTKAKAVYEIMSSLTDKDRGRVGLSVEGKIIRRNAQNPNVIEKCEINAVAITLNPVNKSTYADLVKSMQVEFNSEGEIDFNSKEPVSFTAEQVIEMVQKALSAGAAGTKAPSERTGGEALSMESSGKPKKDEDDLEKKCWEGYKRVPGTKEFEDGSCEKVGKGGPGSGRRDEGGSDEDKEPTSYEDGHKRLMSKYRELSKVPQSKEEFKMLSEHVDKQLENLNSKFGKPSGYRPTNTSVAKSESLLKSYILDIMEKVQALHPETPKADIWEAVKDRLFTRFPNIKDEFNKD